MWRNLLMLGCLGLVLAGAGQVWAQGKIYTTKVDDVDVFLFIPDGVQVLRGVVIHVANYKMSATDRWAELCHTLQFAHLSTETEVRKGSPRPKLLKATTEGLKFFAGETAHPELVNVPLMGTGHSAGGLVSSVVLADPTRALTNCVSCGWIASSEKMTPEAAAVPFLFTLGAIPDAFKMLPDIESNFLPARQKGLPWGLAVQWECAHDFGNSATIFTPWMQAIVEARLPQDWNPLTGPATLRPLKQEDGWLGDSTTTTGNWATIAAWKDYTGDKAAATWFPTRAVANIWRAVMSKDAPLTLEAATPDGTRKLPPFNPKADRGMMVDPGTDLVLGVSVKEGTPVQRVQFYEGDTLLGEATAAPWQFTWKGIPRGPHAIFAQWQTPQGTQGTTNPALITVRANPAAAEK